MVRAFKLIKIMANKWTQHNIHINSIYRLLFQLGNAAY